MAGLRTKRKRGKTKIQSVFPGHNKVKVGFPSGVSEEVVMKAIYNNFGTEHIDERPFMDNAIRGNKLKYSKLMMQAAKKLFRGEIDMTTVMSRIGLVATGDIQEEIINLRSPENSPATVKRKGSSNPLIDTGEMKNSVTHITYD